MQTDRHYHCHFSGFHCRSFFFNLKQLLEKQWTTECESSCYVTAAVLIPLSQSDKLLHPVCTNLVRM